MSTTAREIATSVLEEIADPRVLDLATSLINDGKAEWVFDQEVDGPVGLVLPGTNTALVVVFPETSGEPADFETSDSFDRLMAQEG